MNYSKKTTGLNRLMEDEYNKTVFMAFVGARMNGKYRGETRKITSIHTELVKKGYVPKEKGK